MKITDEDVKRFRQIWEEEFSEIISQEEARAQIQKLDAFLLFLYKRPRSLQGKPALHP